MINTNKDTFYNYMNIYTQEQRCQHFGDVNIFGLVPITCSIENIAKLDTLIKEKNIKSWLVLDLDCLLIVDYDKISKMVKIQFEPIVDYSVPTFDEMDKIVKFIKEYKTKGNILVSCIGGHGRTGTILSIWVGLNGIKKPISYIRNIYCKYAVETLAQEMFVNTYLKSKNIQV